MGVVRCVYDYPSGMSTLGGKTKQLVWTLMVFGCLVNWRELRQRKHKVITEIRNLHDVALLTAWRDGEVSTTDLEIESELSRLVERVQSPEFLAEIAEVRAPWASVLRANRLKSG